MKIFFYFTGMVVRNSRTVVTNFRTAARVFKGLDVLTKHFECPTAIVFIISTMYHYKRDCCATSYNKRYNVNI